MGIGCQQAYFLDAGFFRVKKFLRLHNMFSERFLKKMFFGRGRFLCFVPPVLLQGAAQDDQ